jgi:pimeloyl-ACP methyl ester carboxylesterase
LIGPREARYRVWRLQRKREESRPTLKLGMRGRSRTLLLAFGGLNRRIGMPPFEFLTLTGDLPVKRMFLRDPRAAWYHRGLPGRGETLTAVADSLRAEISKLGVERLIVAGNSGGGYAALAFGTLLRADLVLAFAPRTVLDVNRLAAMGESCDELHALAAAGALDRRWTDLGEALRDARDARTRYRVFFDTTHDKDRLHAERLAGLEGLRMYRFGRGGHELVRHLRDIGALERILREAVAAPAEAGI